MTKKSPAMLFSTVTFWAGLNLHFGSRYWQVVKSPEMSVGKIAAACIMAWILLASFYACFHTMSFLFSLVVRRYGRPLPVNNNARPPVAVLYTTRDDLQEAALRTCVQQDYAGPFHIFVLDDSRDPAERERVDAACALHPGRITCIRRADQRGFKAGNINHALNLIGDEYPYVAIADADEVLPSEFLRKLVAIAEANPNLGFVQAAHRMYGRSDFGRRAGDGLDLHWSHFLPARGRFGFVYFFGHGALLRTAAIRAVGGVPELVSEDVALGMAMLGKGFGGHFAGHVVCQEEVPASFRAYRTRHKKVIRGTMELLFRAFPTFLLDRRVGWVEKLDLGIATAGLFLPIPFLGFCVLLHMVMPYSLTDTCSAALHTVPSASFGHAGAELFRPLWGWDTLCFTVFTVFAPLCYVLPDLLRMPGKVLKYVFHITSISLSTVPLTVLQSFSWLGTRRSSFANTGASKPSRRSGARLETAIGACIFVGAVMTGSPFLLAFGISVLTIPLLLRTDGGGLLASWLLPVPMILTLLAFAGMPLALLGFSGALVGVTLAYP